MKKFILIAAIAAVYSSSFGQDSGEITAADVQAAQAILSMQSETNADSVWTTGGTLGLNFSQVYLSNWAAGGQSSISATGLVNLFANYKKGDNTWDNTLDLAYGLLNQGSNGIVLKTDDKIDMSSKYGRKASEKWYYSALFNFRTQFAPGYPVVDGAPDKDNKISDAFAPAYTLLALGMDYKPNKKFSAFISPVTMKNTIVLDDSLSANGAFGVDPGSNFRAELGGYLKFQYTTELVKNVSLASKLNLFSNYLHNPQNIDVNWENLISMKINEFMNATISTQLLYDDDIKVVKEQPTLNDDGEVTDPGNVGPGVQFKEVLAIGFSYKF